MKILTLQHYFINKQLYSKVITALLAFSTLLYSYLDFNFDKSDDFIYKLQHFILPIFNGNVFICLIGLPVLISVIFNFILFFAEKKYNYLNNIKFKDTLDAFDNIVSSKVDRFSKYVVEKDKNPFLDITKPDEQIKLLFRQFYNVLKDLKINDNIKLVLIECYNNQLTSNIINMPEKSIDGTKDLNLEKNTFFNHILTKKSHDVIYDLKVKFNEQSGSNKRKKEYTFKDDKVEEGSIVGFCISKINEKNKIANYILTIKFPENPINKDIYEKIKEIFKSFEKRFLLEIELDRIKKEYSNQD